MRVVLVKSTMCEICAVMVPAVIANEDIVVELLDLETNPAQCVPLNIRAVPTMIIYNNNDVEVSRKIGFMSPDTVIEWLLAFGAM